MIFLALLSSYSIRRPIDEQPFWLSDAPMSPSPPKSQGGSRVDALDLCGRPIIIASYVVCILALFLQLDSMYIELDYTEEKDE